MNENHDRSHLTRREVLQGLGVAGAAIGLGPAILAGCGGDNSSGSGSATTGGSSGSSGGAAGDVGARLRSALNLNDTDKLGGDLNWKMGAVLALTGNGSYYGKTMTSGIDLAVKHIKAAGGPSIDVIYKDHKSGDPAAGVNAVTELGAASVPAKLASYGDDIGAMAPRTEQYKIMTFDGGGGVGGSLQGRPYLWGTRAQVALDQFPGLFRWTKEAFPDVKSIGFTGWDLGEPLNTDLRNLMTKAVADAGYEFNGLLEQFAPNTSDFSQVIPKVKANLPDLLLLYAFGQDCGLFQNQAQSAGLDVNTVGFEFTPDGLNGAKGAFEQGWTFTYDYFAADSAASPLGKLFVDEYRSANKGDPDFYAANYYEDTLAMWDLIRRVLATGGDPNSGTDLENALKANPTFVSVYGGDAGTNGTLKLDLTTHSVSQRFMGVFTYKHGKVTTDATFDIGGANYKKAS